MILVWGDSEPTIFEDPICEPEILIFRTMVQAIDVGLGDSKPQKATKPRHLKQVNTHTPSKIKLLICMHPENGKIQPGYYNKME